MTIKEVLDIIYDIQRSLDNLESTLKSYVAGCPNKEVDLYDLERYIVVGATEYRLSKLLIEVRALIVEVRDESYTPKRFYFDSMGYGNKLYIAQAAMESEKWVYEALKSD